MRRALPLPALALTLALTGCIPHANAPAPKRTRTAAPAYDDPRVYRQCLADLAALSPEVRIDPLPDRVFPNGCSATSAVKLVAIGIPVTNLGALKCGLALPFTRWVRESVPEAATRTLGARVVRIESYGSFACRPVNNVEGNKLSEHGRANAVDIAAFVLADGRRITVKDGWNGPDANARAFLRMVHAQACRRFAIVLGPDANALHHDHLHFDMGNGAYCR